MAPIAGPAMRRHCVRSPPLRALPATDF